MDGYQFVSSLAGSLAWPVAAVILVHQLRAPLGKLIPLIRSMKYKELQIDLASKVETVELEVVASSTPNLASPDTTKFDKLAEMDPRAAISVAWIPLQTEIFQMAEKEGISSWDAYSPAALVRQLRDREIIPTQLADPIIEMSEIRDSAAIGEVGTVTAMLARRINRICVHMVELLQQIQQNRH